MYVSPSPRNSFLFRLTRGISGIDVMRLYTSSGRSFAALGVSACTLSLAGSAPRLNRLSFLLAFGVHLNILCIIAQLHYMRDDLLDSPRYPNSRLLVMLGMLTLPAR